MESRVRGARAERREDGGYDVIPDSEGIIERNDKGELFFKSEKTAMHFCRLQMLFHVVVEPVD
jgi:hypothetical protein